MIESVILSLIYILVIAAVIYIILWILSTVAGVQLPEKVIQIIWIVFALVCLLILVRLLLPGLGVKLGALLPMLA
jgi:hypothetical protein